MKKMNNKGFTIVELVIVIAVIAILAAVMIPTFSGIVTKANESAVLQVARSYYTDVYADDISDDGIQNASNLDNSGKLDTTKFPGCTYDKTTFVFTYTDTKKDIKATFTAAGVWEVGDATPATPVVPS